MFGDQVLFGTYYPAFVTGVLRRRQGQAKSSIEVSGGHGSGERSFLIWPFVERYKSS